jgi:pimeloyl-ACP methyl ester carboxylesterase
LSADSTSTHGTHLPLDVEKKGHGPPLVLLHGFGASRFSFNAWSDELARGHTVHLVDLFGMGSAPAPEDGCYGPVNQAAAVIRWLREEDLWGAVLIGHSLGGGVALLVALELIALGERRRLAGLVSVAGPAYPQSIPTYIGLARVPLLGRAMFGLLGAERIVRRVLAYIVYDPAAVTVAQVEGYAAPLRHRAARRAVVETARHIVPAGLEEIVARLPTIDLPALLLWGRHDPVIPLWVGERLERELPRARLVVLERCGHLPPEELPEASLEAVLSFIAGLGAHPPGRPPV